MTTTAIRPPRHRAPWTEAELFHIVSQFEHASLDTIAANLGRSRGAIEQALAVARIRRRQGARTPAQVARATGYSPGPIELVAIELQIGIKTSQSKHRRRWLSESEVERILDWLRNNSMREWSKHGGKKSAARRKRVSTAQGNRHAAHPSRERWKAGDPYGERVVLRSEARGIPGRRAWCHLLVCAEGHASWVVQSEMVKGAAQRCGVCFAPSRVRPAYVGIVASTSSPAASPDLEPAQR